MHIVDENLGQTPRMHIVDTNLGRTPRMHIVDTNLGQTSRMCMRSERTILGRRYKDSLFRMHYIYTRV